MSGPHGADPGQGDGFAEQPTTQTPWQAPSAWQQPVPAADQATTIAPNVAPTPPAAPAWGQASAPGYGAPGQPDPATTAYPPQGPPGYPPAGYPAAPNYSAPPSAPIAAPGYGQPASGGYPGYGAQPAAPGYPSYGAAPASPYGPPPQYGAPGAPAAGMPGAEPGAKSSRNLIVIVASVAAVVVAALLVTGFWKPGFFVTTTLDITKAQQGVQQILSDDTNGYGAKNVKDVKCNNGTNPKVNKGDTFTCEVSIDGAKRQVTVTFTDSKGTYEVGRPK